MKKIKLTRGYTTAVDDEETLDNRRENLRIATGAQNNGNQHKRRSVNQFIGVEPHKKKYRACVGHEGRRYRSRSFVTQREAARAYDALALKLRGEVTHLNFPPKSQSGGSRVSDDARFGGRWV